MLALVGGLASGGINWLHMGILIGEAGAFALFMMFIAPRLVHRMETGVEQGYAKLDALIAELR